jgi:predicted nuclease of predicted toxin-antitoxin system
LRHLGEEVAHVRDVGLERSLDSEIVERARADGSIVVTFDLDFSDILALGVLDKPSVIIFRLADERADSVNRRLATVINERRADLESGALILVEDARYRVRKLPIGSS